ncbi:MAG: lipoprotein [Candidatus Magnetoglobus multicellularis str. Araruama]|uniref:Lipoprotein n=1 Tax=Candidatus Magnetoglobus multicellularis str. Araruama TaxID=890399 RepID=A0A1V1PH65_9BACT|nr:MAG: lipoprotein [Candidatus Magnetoglobus multicellularis str. Araruama]
MNNLVINKTKTTPEINFDCNTHQLSISGHSYPENISEFYGSIFMWLEEYLDQVDEDQSITVNIDLTYFNSTSSKVMMDMFDIFDEAVDDGKNITLNWIYDKEDPDSLEFGEEFQDNLENMQMTFVPK